MNQKLTTEQKLKEMGVTVTHSKPPVFEACEKEFGIKWDNTIFAYDPHIHSKHKVHDGSTEHELIHIRQQRDFGGPQKWWDTYFKDSSKRLEWEMEAYKHQYKYFKSKGMDKNELYRYVYMWATNLSGQGYGHLINLNEAIKQIIQ